MHHEQAPAWVRRSEALTRAYDLAREAHGGDSGKDGRSRYIRHPLAVADRLAERGDGEATLVAAILHDVVEHTEVGMDEVVTGFGVRVGELVAALTEDGSIQRYEERKHEHRRRVAEAGERAGAIYAADKIDNVSALRRVHRERGAEALAQLKAPVEIRLELWRRDAEMLSRLDGCGPLAATLEGELEALESEVALARRSVETA